MTNLPVFNNAGLSKAGLLVAKITLILPKSSKPSIWFNISISVLWISIIAEEPSLALLPSISSISSIKIIQVD